LIAQLDNSYGSKTSAKLTTNADELKKPWDASTPIQSLFIRVVQCHRFDTTIPEDTIVRQVVDLICVHRGFESAYATWEPSHAVARQDMGQPQDSFWCC
jgi:hypothetical protein